MSSDPQMLALFAQVDALYQAKGLNLLSAWWTLDAELFDFVEYFQ